LYSSVTTESDTDSDTDSDSDSISSDGFVYSTVGIPTSNEFEVNYYYRSCDYGSIDESIDGFYHEGISNEEVEVDYDLSNDNSN